MTVIGIKIRIFRLQKLFSNFFNKSIRLKTWENINRKAILDRFLHLAQTYLATCDAVRGRQSLHTNSITASGFRRIKLIDTPPAAVQRARHGGSKHELLFKRPSSSTRHQGNKASCL